MNELKERMNIKKRGGGNYTHILYTIKKERNYENNDLGVDNLLFQDNVVDLFVLSVCSYSLN